LILLLIGTGTVGWWLWSIYRSPNRADVSAYWQLVFAIAALVVPVIPLLRRSGTTRTVGTRSELDRLADAVWQQWQDAATARRLLEPIAVRWTRPHGAMAGSSAAATASTRFAPIPGLTRIREERLNQGGLRDLHTLYGGLGSGRLLIAGAPGSGKSGAAVLLVLAALHHRRDASEADRANVPVPVLFTLHGWDPTSQPVLDWLLTQLRQTYDTLFTGPLGARSAETLLRNDKIAVILDGLDEIGGQLQPVALRALSEQAIFRLVVLARSAELTDAAAQAMLDGAAAVELRDVEPAATADYLARIQRDPPPDRWRELIDQVGNAPDGPLARALSNPLTLTLLRDTYRAGDTVGELLDYYRSRPDISREDIADHLLDRVLHTAYTPRPGQPAPRYSLATAQRTLGLVAAQMSRRGTRELAWWRIPTWTAALPRVLAIGLASGLLLGLGLVCFGWAPGEQVVVIPVAFVGALGGMTGASLVARKPTHTGFSRWRFAFSHPSLVFVIGLVFGYLLIVDYVYRLPSVFLTAWLAVGLVMLAAWLAIGLAILIARPIGRRGAPVRWVAARRHPLMVFGTGVTSGLVGIFFVFLFFGKLGIILMLSVLSLLGLGLGLWLGLRQPRRGSVAPLTPLASWSRDRTAGLGCWCGLGVLTSDPLITLTPLLTKNDWLLVAIVQALEFLAGLVLGLIYPETWVTSLASLQLAVHRRTPIHLMRFLDDARERNVLRTVGPVYQFRHARLQDRLARPLRTAQSRSPYQAR
jgi:hypothetical protein